MAYEYTQAASRVYVSGSANLNLNGRGTFMMWMYPTASITNRCILHRGTAITKGWRMRISGSTGSPSVDLRMVVSQSTLDTEYFSKAAPVLLNRWNFIAVTVDVNAAALDKVHFYVGQDNAVVSETGISQITEGTGTPLEEASASLVIGNTFNSSAQFPGQHASFHYVNRPLSFAEVRQQQFTPSPVSGTLLMTEFRQNALFGDSTGQGYTLSPENVNVLPHPVRTSV